MMLSGDSGQGESICTPNSVSKRLFGASGSSSKRSLFGRSEEFRSKDAETSGDDSDLGPMSALALTDGTESSRESSPGRSFVSPLVTPETSPRNSSFQTWDRLKPNSSKHSFDMLKTLTRAARSSPNRKLFPNSPKSLLSTPTRKNRDETNSWVIGTPEREMALLFDEEIVPETPQKGSNDENYEDDNRVQETPEKTDRKLEHRLVTPLSCVSNEIVIPRLHRRKSLCLLDSEKTLSPERRENLLKRRAIDYPQSAGAKIPKTDDSYSSSVPKARASLFPETEKSDSSPKGITSDFTISAKSFYKNTIEKRGYSIGNVDNTVIEPAKKRHSMPSYVTHHSHSRRAPRRSAVRRGEMNSGVRHGIKRPKPKRHISRVEAFKTKNNKTESKGSDEQQIEKSPEIRPEPAKIIVDPAPRPAPPSPVVDPNKRFFKTNRTLKSQNVATVTVNNKIKLKVSDGKIALNEKHSPHVKNPHKRPRLEEMTFDATDLTVDEPNLDSSTETRNNVVDGILKVLENDWADDDYDTMETLTNLSPTRNESQEMAQNSCQNILMSPASVLSNMTLSMNIQDTSNGTKASNNTNSEKKLYPLFEKGYTANIGDENSMANKKKNERGTKRSWQTSVKGGGAEDQYQIDAGQKRFGATTCNECGIVYQLGDPEDENAHLNYHNNVKSLKFNGWKQERVVWTDPLTNSRIISIEPGDSKQCWKKVEQVLTVVDEDLGLAEMELTGYLDKRIYFYVRDKAILGVLVAENIKVAHRMIPEFADLNCCSAEDTAAKCGVNVIWTAMSHRRQHIATKLLDILRTCYFFGYIMSLEDIAFSMPTPSGKIFAEKYTKTPNFKVYS
ncbi:N-acetyltransferase ESCO1 [Venturia canescens]|uniref:N-acetyltransferase ESCO1 n=1 Tax=Venturia canescens TaxID=32260 RepID=UPI001C9CA818|nr:N-acetyltransferase ESCO1 [Venturia canescens]